MIIIDADPELCHMVNISATLAQNGSSEPVGRLSKTVPEIKFAHGGHRVGAGRPRKLAIPVAHIPAIQRWGVLSFWGQAEQSATSELTRSGYETYLPMVAIRRRDPVIPTKFNIARVPYLAGYGFIRITATESREPILAIRGVREVLLRPDGRPACVSDGEIERMRASDVERLELPAASAPTLAAGSIVRVEEGALTSFTGAVIQCDGFKTQVGVEMFGRVTPVWLDRTMVSPI